VKQAVIPALLAFATMAMAFADEPGYGPAVGERVPDFAAPDQNRRMRRLADLRGPRGLVLVFFRSADW